MIEFFQNNIFTSKVASIVTIILGTLTIIKLLFDFLKIAIPFFSFKIFLRLWIVYVLITTPVLVYFYGWDKSMMPLNIAIFVVLLYDFSEVRPLRKDNKKMQEQLDTLNLLVVKSLGLSSYKNTHKQEQTSSSET